MTVSHQSGNTSHTGLGSYKSLTFACKPRAVNFISRELFAVGIQNGITRRCLSLPICTTHFTGYLTDVGTGLGLWARETVNGNNPPTLLKVLLFAAGLLFFGLGGVAAKELHGPFNMQGALLAAGLMGAVSAGLVPVVKVKKTA
eukprot:symbB.v1.2.021285.t1/scaffold1833.1/size99481/3